MKVVVAIDSFKGSMTSMQAGNACKKGSHLLMENLIHGRLRLLVLVR